MGLLDGIRGFLKGTSDCGQLIWYQSRVFEFRGLGAEVPGLTVSLAGIKVGIRKLEHATEVAKNLDMYQFQLCRLTRELGKHHPLREEIIKVRIVGLGFLTSFSNTLSAFNADPKGERTNLYRAVREMQDFVRDVAKSIMSQLSKGADALSKEEILSNLEKAPTGSSRPVIRSITRDWAGGGATRYPSRKRPRASSEQRAQKRTEALSRALAYVGLEKSELEELTKEVSENSMEEGRS